MGLGPRPLYKAQRGRCRLQLTLTSYTTAKPAEINRELAALRRVFNLAVQAAG
jgi:hypothetical protein